MVSSFPPASLKPVGRPKIVQVCILTCASWFLSNFILLRRQLPFPEPELQRRIDHQARFPTGDQSTVLITGVAGFLGYSAALYLLHANLSKVVGIDSFISHTGSPLLELKHKRADILSHYGNINVSRGDICDPHLLRELLQRHSFTHIIYFASEEEKHERDKREANTANDCNRTGDRGQDKALAKGDLCFLTLLEELRALKKATPCLIYESSSTFVRRQRAHTWEKLVKF